MLNINRFNLKHGNKTDHVINRGWLLKFTNIRKFY
jgi:hypothetical protein